MEIELNMQRFQGGRNKLKQWEEELVKHVTKGQQSTSRRFAYEKIKTIINDPHTSWDATIKVKVGARLVQLLTEEAKTQNVCYQSSFAPAAVR